MNRKLLYTLTILSIGIIWPGAPEPSRAEDSPSRFGALQSFFSARMCGYVFDYADKESARKGAVEECRLHAEKNDCKAVVDFEDGCGALAVGDIGYGTGWGGSLGTAQRHARDSCMAWTGGCQIVRWVCTTNAIDKK